MSTSKIIFSVIGGFLLTWVLVLGFTFLTFSSLDHNGDLKEIGLDKPRDVEARYYPLADRVVHYKFSADRKEVRTIIGTLELDEKAPEGLKQIAKPMFFYPPSGNKETYYGNAGYASLYLYYYPEKQLAYYVHHDS
ncbi:hypothetical protein NBRC116583_39270 [Arenicella sp. 4NH20-0111]|uniref:hypothetical protein n=1 Tax=Arenicella sp. 4NH20-0111 TaxID=3127648 RepID=UPI003108ACC7